MIPFYPIEVMIFKPNFWIAGTYHCLNQTDRSHLTYLVNQVDSVFIEWDNLRNQQNWKQNYLHGSERRYLDNDHLYLPADDLSLLHDFTRQIHEGQCLVAYLRDAIFDPSTSRGNEFLYLLDLAAAKDILCVNVDRPVTWTYHHALEIHEQMGRSDFARKERSHYMLEQCLAMPARKRLLVVGHDHLQDYYTLRAKNSLRRVS